MIRQLTAPCWYFECDPWEEPHWASEAEALYDESEAAAATAREPRPVLRTAAPCWVADCDRCGRLLAEDDTSAEVHCGSGRALSAELEAARWRVVAGGRLCCGGCATARPAMDDVERVEVTVRAAGTCWYWSEVGEVTACPQLAITVRRAEPGGRWLGLVLTHRPTGMYLPTAAWTSDVGVLHRVAELLSALDWSSTDPADYATGYTEPVLDALDQAEAEHAGWLDGAR